MYTRASKLWRKREVFGGGEWKAYFVDVYYDKWRNTKSYRFRSKGVSIP